MNELGDGTEKWNRKMAKCAGTPNSYTTKKHFDHFTIETIGILELPHTCQQTSCRCQTQGKTSENSAW